MGVDLAGADALLLVGDSERSADLLYSTGFRAPDPYVFLWTRHERLVMVSDLELDRARAQARVDRVLASAQIEAGLRQRGVNEPGSEEVLVALLAALAVQRVRVPAEFPLGLAEALRRAGVGVEVAPSPLFPERQRKSEAEIAAVEHALRAAEAAMAAAVGMIRSAQARPDGLWLDGAQLTSERVRRTIHRELLDWDCSATGTIVAGGDQGCDPHQEGHGPLRAGESIIIDIFPRSQTSGYFGDLTRTVVWGQAPPALRRLFATVRQGQELALTRIQDGAVGRHVHQAVVDLFAEAGYPTGERDGHMEGFFHGTGHGLGLEIHEAPRIGSRGTALSSGQVVTVEPGLYYPGVGGVRLEDVVVVRPGGCQNLTRCPTVLEL
jgi:Xaa-Pro aminopeptidase